MFAVPPAPERDCYLDAAHLNPTPVPAPQARLAG